MEQKLTVNNETYGGYEVFDDFEAFKKAINDSIHEGVEEVIIKTPAKMPKNPSMGVQRCMKLIKDLDNSLVTASITKNIGDVRMENLLRQILDEQKKTNEMLRIIVSNSEQKLLLQKNVVSGFFMIDETDSQVEFSVVDESR